MLLAIPVIGKILGSLAASEASAASGPQKTDAPKTSGSANAADFAQTVDRLDPAAGAKTGQHSPLAGGKV
jgi:hypothetical protein